LAHYDAVRRGHPRHQQSLNATSTFDESPAKSGGFLRFGGTRAA
jgi:hypothetical protein